jgi:single-strand DNA-binding protein
MSIICINRVILTGNLTRDPELRTLPSGNSVCDLRLAVSTKWRNPTGNWNDQTNYFDVSVFGGQGETVAKYMQKGRPVAIDGRLRWREWETKDGRKAQAVNVIAETVQFLGVPDSARIGNGNGNGNGEEEPGGVSGDNQQVIEDEALSLAGIGDF